MLDPLFRFALVTAAIAAAYGAIAWGALVAWRANTPFEPSPQEILALNLAAVAAALLVGYAAYARWVFRNRSASVRSFVRYVLTTVACIGVHEAAFYALIASTAIPYPLALAATLIVIGAATFLLMRHWTFAR